MPAPLKSATNSAKKPRIISKKKVFKSSRPKFLEMLSILEVLYPNPRSELLFQNAYQLVIAVVLSAQCTDKKVNQVTAILFEQLPDFNSLSLASEELVARILGPINYFKTKTKHIIKLSQLVITEHKGSLPLDYEALINLPGVGRKTANVVLGELGVVSTLPVDTHVYRLSRRLGLSRASSVIRVEQDLTKLFPPDLWRTLHHSLILHGRKICKAQRPLCQNCGLARLCPSAEIS